MLLPPWIELFGRAVEQELVVPVLAAVDRPVGDGAVVERPLIDRRPVVGDAGREIRQHERIARVQRQLRDALVVDDEAAVGLRDLGRFGDDGDDFGQFADLQRDVHGLRLADFELHELLEPPESLQLRRDLVLTGSQEGERIQPHVVGQRGDDLVGLRVGDRDRHARHPSAGRVTHTTGDRRAELLRGRGPGQCQDTRPDRLLPSG